MKGHVHGVIPARPRAPGQPLQRKDKGGKRPFRAEPNRAGTQFPHRDRIVLFDQTPVIHQESSRQNGTVGDENKDDDAERAQHQGEAAFASFHGAPNPRPAAARVAGAGFAFGPQGGDGKFFDGS